MAVRPIVSGLSHLVLRRFADAQADGLPALMMAAERAVQSLYTGDHTQPRAGSGEKFWQFRDYDPADRPQDIDWKQSAKGDRVYIRQKQQQNAQAHLFWVQNDRGMDLKSPRLPHSKRDAATIIALGLAMMVMRAGDRIGPLSTASPRTGRSATDLLHLGEVLHHTPDRIADGPTLPMAASLPRNAALCLCGDFMAPAESTDMALRALAAHTSGGVIVQILDPMEITLPFNGRVIFKSFDDTNTVPVANVPSIRDQYAIRLRDHIDAVRGLARRYGLVHILHNTGTPPRETLQNIWMAVEAQRG
jgi:uncharacterized protein (DUF58 family)